MAQLGKKDRKLLIDAQHLRCRGPRGVGLDPLIVLFDKRRKDKDAPEDARKFAALCHNICTAKIPKKLGLSIDSVGSVDDALRVAFARQELKAASEIDRCARAGCGYDFGKIVYEGPHDGEKHDYECPNCGVEGKYIAPTFDADDEELQARLAALKGDDED